MRKKLKLIISVLIFAMLFVSNIVLANYRTRIEGKVSAILKSFIFVCNEPDIIQGPVGSIEHNYYENTFSILNYIEQSNLEESEIINDIAFEYTIQVLPSTFNFPVKYSLINLNTNEELALNSNLETDKLSFGKTRENYNYKLIAEWDSENNNQNLEANLDVEILVKGVQKK